jgi:hypothetical protein
MKNIATIALLAASAAFAGCASPQNTATTKEGKADTKAVAKAGTPSEAKTDTKTVEEDIEKEKKSNETLQKQKQEVLDSIQQEAGMIHQYNMEKGDISRQINQQEMKINNISAQEHMISQNIEINTRAVKDT